MDSIIEESDFVAPEHDNLIRAVLNLNKTKHVKATPIKSVATSITSRNCEAIRSVDLGANALPINLEDTAHQARISRKLKNNNDALVLSKRLEKPQAERIKRATRYEKTKVTVGRWDPVVARSRTVDFVSFPLKRPVNKLEPTKDYLAKPTLKSNIEKELDKIDPPQPELSDQEEEKFYPMTHQDMLEYGQQMAKLRAQQSYKAAKAKRQSKIKSKKYHRILKKERLKQQLKEFEELQKTNPEEALKQLESLEKARVLERHTLRHKNTGKWAKNKLVRAKYDKEVRQQLAEQLAVSRGLTKKVQEVNDTDDESNDDDEVIPDIENDPMNPWVLKRSDKSNIDAAFEFGYKKYLKERKESDSESDEEDKKKPTNDIENKNVDDIVDSNNHDKNKGFDNFLLKAHKEKITANPNDHKIISETHVKQEQRNIVVVPKDKVLKNNSNSGKLTKSNKLNKIKITSTSDWVVENVKTNKVCNTLGDLKIKKKSNKLSNKNKKTATEDLSTAFESFETKVVEKVEKKLKQLRKDIKNLENQSQKTVERKNEKQEIDKVDNLEYLKLKQQNVKAIIDEELIETGSRNMENTFNDNTVSKFNNMELEKNTYDKPNDKIVSKIKNDSLNNKNAKTESNTNLELVYINNNPKYLDSTMPENDVEIDQLDDDDEQVVPIKKINEGVEAYEDEDIVTSFRKEKEDEVNKDMPVDVDSTLPGWGCWGGKGVKAPKRKKNRYIVKAPPKIPRKDENKGSIIIKEYKDPKLIEHKIKDVPFPFSSVKDYEASIRAPMGNTFIPEKAHKKLIRPSVITRAGTIIDPMDDDELLVPRNQNYKNESVIKLLGKK